MPETINEFFWQLVLLVRQQQCLYPWKIDETSARNQANRKEPSNNTPQKIVNKIQCKQYFIIKTQTEYNEDPNQNFQQYTEAQTNTCIKLGGSAPRQRKTSQLTFIQINMTMVCNKKQHLNILSRYHKSLHQRHEHGENISIKKEPNIHTGARG